MHFQRSKSTLDSLESVFKNVFRRQSSLGAPTKRVCAAEKDMGFKVLSLEICLEQGVFWTGSLQKDSCRR